MLGSSVVSQIAAEDLTFAANFIQSRTFRAFEAYFVSTAIYLVLAILLRQVLIAAGSLHFPEEKPPMIEFSLWDILRNLLLAARWTVVLSLVSFVGGGTGRDDPVVHAHRTPRAHCGCLPSIMSSCSRARRC